MTLDQFLQSAASRPWVWGSDDCTMWVADWCVIRWGFDPAARYRGSYQSKSGADLLTSAGLEAVIGPEMHLRRKDAPDVGDVGIVAVAGLEVSAIWTGNLWIFRTARGLSGVSHSAIAVWGD